MIEEACLPWAPLPERFSRNWPVDVVHVPEGYTAVMRPAETLAIAVAAYAEPTPTRPRADAAWRIDFRGCRAYRKRIIDYVGADPLSSPDSYRSTGLACWEIAPSRYLVESGVRSAYPAQEFHH
jgi:hypothetical protein